MTDQAPSRFEWAPLHPAFVHLQASCDGRPVPVKVCYYDAPGGPHWVVYIRRERVGERVATVAEAQAVAEAAWTAEQIAP